jgi:hypothetical protein
MIRMLLPFVRRRGLSMGISSVFFKKNEESQSEFLAPNFFKRLQLNNSYDNMAYFGVICSKSPSLPFLFLSLRINSLETKLSE